MTTTTDNSAALAALLGTHGVPETSIPALVADVLTQVAAIPPNPDWQTRRDLRAALRQTLVAHGVRCWDTAAFVEYHLLPDKPFKCERIHGHYMSTPLSIAEAEPTGFAGLDARFHSWASDGQIQVRVVVYPDNHPSVEQILTLPCHWVRPDIHQGNGTYELPPTEWVRECQVRYPGASCFFRVGDRLETWDPRVPSTTVRSIIQPGQTDPTVRQLIPAARWSEMDELALLARLAVQYAPVAICRHYGGREDAAMVVHPWAWDRPSESPRVGSDTAMLAGYLFERPTGQPVVRLVLTPDREHYQVFPDPDGEDLALVERLMPTQTIDRRPGCFYVGQRLLLLQAGYYLIIQRSPTQVQVITPESWELLRHTPYCAAPDLGTAQNRARDYMDAAEFARWADHPTMRAILKQWPGAEAVRALYSKYYLLEGRYGAAVRTARRNVVAEIAAALPVMLRAFWYAAREGGVSWQPAR